jgi:hypothetical protein
MAAKPKTYYEKVVARRRNSDILKLQETYSRAVEDYGVASAQKQTEYEKQMADYSKMFGTYEQKYADFKSRADTYNKALEAFNTKTYLEYKPGAGFQSWTGYDWGGVSALSGKVRANQLYGQSYFWFDTPNSKYGGRFTGETRSSIEEAFQSNLSYLKPGWTFEPDTFNKGGMSGTVYKRGGADPGEFTEKFEEKPPETPAAMDLTAEKAKLEFEKSTMEREIDERTKSRLRAARRGSGAQMLSAGVTVTPMENPNG